MIAQRDVVTWSGVAPVVSMAVNLEEHEEHSYQSTAYISTSMLPKTNFSRKTFGEPAAPEVEGEHSDAPRKDLSFVMWSL